MDPPFSNGDGFLSLPVVRHDVLYARYDERYRTAISPNNPLFKGVYAGLKATYKATSMWCVQFGISRCFVKDHRYGRLGSSDSASPLRLSCGQCEPMRGGFLRKALERSPAITCSAARDLRFAKGEPRIIFDLNQAARPSVFLRRRESFQGGVSFS